MNFIRKIRKDTQFAFPKKVEIALHGPSGIAISPTKSISVLMLGNSAENPLRVQVSDASKPTSNAKLTKFWNSLRGMKPENGFLKFRTKAEFIPTLMESLYIRKAYEDFFNIISESTKPTDLEKRINRMAIIGTPGIGKSMFLFYVMWRLANMEDKKTVILRRHMDNGKIYVFQSDGCWVTSSPRNIAKFLENPDTWYLAGALLSPPGMMKAIVILVSSPARKFYSNFLKILPVLPLYYLPIWSLEELKLVASSYGKEPEEVEERFDKIGGIARYVLEYDGDLDLIIKECLQAT